METSVVCRRGRRAILPFKTMRMCNVYDTVGCRPFLNRTGRARRLSILLSIPGSCLQRLVVLQALAEKLHITAQQRSPVLP